MAVSEVRLPQTFTEKRSATVLRFPAPPIEAPGEADTLDLLGSSLSWPEPDAGAELALEARPARRGLLGELLVREGLVTEAQLEGALRLQAASHPDTPLGQILVECGAITGRQLNRILASYHKKYRLGDLLVETEAISEVQLQIALEHRKKTGLRLGDVLLQLNFVTEEEISRALCTQFGVTFVDLDRLVLDNDLKDLVDRDYAQAHGVIPISKTEGVLVLAMEDPSDLALVTELEARTGCRINVVTSTQAAFQRASRRVYGESLAGLARRHEALARAHEVIRQEYEASVRRLAALRSAQSTLVRERDHQARALAEERMRNEGNTQALAELREAHAALRRESEAALAQERARREASDQTLAQLEEGHAALRRQHAETTGALEELQVTHDDLVQAHQRHAQECWERGQTVLEERQHLAEQLEALLRRVRS